MSVTISSEEDNKRWKEEMGHLSRSASLEDRVVAILMDLNIGGHGDRGDGARAKAAAILKLFEFRESASQVKISLEVAEEVRRMVMADMAQGCGQCHWANDYVADRVKELEKIRSKGVAS